MLILAITIIPESIKNLNRNEVEKILSSNDKVLEKYFKAHRQENCAICI
jgi:hypothetical protein